MMAFNIVGIAVNLATCLLGFHLYGWFRSHRQRLKSVLSFIAASIAFGCAVTALIDVLRLVNY